MSYREPLQNNNYQPEPMNLQPNQQVQQVQRVESYGRSTPNYDWKDEEMKVLKHLVEKEMDEFHAKRLENKGMVVRINGENFQPQPIEATVKEESKMSETVVGAIAIGVMVGIFKILTAIV